MEGSKDESPVAPSNDQTQTTKAHAHTRIPLAALPPREGAAPAGTANKDAGYVGPACPINWLGESGQSEGAGRRAGGGEDWVEGKTGKGAEAGLTRAADIGDETPDKPTECAARPEDNAFMEKFLSDSRLARLSPDQPPRPAVAEISQAAAAAAATDDLHDSEREQMRSELGALEDALRFLELDLVSLMERSRDDLYEICSPSSPAPGSAPSDCPKKTSIGSLSPSLPLPSPFLGPALSPFLSALSSLCSLSLSCPPSLPAPSPCCASSRPIRNLSSLPRMPPSLLPLFPPYLPPSSSSSSSSSSSFSSASSSASSSSSSSFSFSSVSPKSSFSSSFCSSSRSPVRL